MITTVSVIGAGVMGSGIATVSLMGGYSVNLVDISPDFLAKGKSKIEKNLAKSVEKQTITEDQRVEMLGRLTVNTEFSTIQKSDLIIEAISEDMAIKKMLFSELNTYAPDGAIIGSNTSALKISALADLYKNPDRVLGIHFFNPPVVMKLVELINARQTNSAVFEAVKNFVGTLRKDPVVVQESPGFVVNRILIPMINEAALIFEEGVASAADIDKAMQLGANHPIGPLALADVIGIDICVSIMETLQRDFASDKYKPAPIMEKMITEGKLGRKSGSGFYEY